MIKKLLYLWPICLLIILAFYGININRKYIQVNSMYFYILNKNEIHRYSSSNNMDNIIFENDSILFNNEQFYYEYKKGYKKHDIYLYDKNHNPLFSLQTNKLDRLKFLYKADFKIMVNFPLASDVMYYEDGSSIVRNSNSLNDFKHVLMNTIIVHIQYQTFIFFLNVLLFLFIALWLFFYLIFIKKYKILKKII